MTGKKRRQAAIREILTASYGSTQEKIKEALDQRGIQTSQSSLSRDLREMGAVKIPTVDGKLVYRLGASYELNDLGKAMKAFSTGYEPVGNFLVIRTATGNAPGLCVILDRQHWPEIVGTVAGDDTILVIAHTARDIESVIDKLEKSIGEEK
ncbi:arginine repressor [bacterium]|nr:arginine repressor [bacterium]